MTDLRSGAPAATQRPRTVDPARWFTEAVRL